MPPGGDLFSLDFSELQLDGYASDEGTAPKEKTNGRGELDTTVNSKITCKSCNQFTCHHIRTGAQNLSLPR